jgi:hypothetical protein
LEENKRQGEEDQEFEKRVEGKKAAAKKRATRRSKLPLSITRAPCSLMTCMYLAARKKTVQVEEPDSD